MQAQRVVVTQPSMVTIETFDTTEPGPGEVLVKSRVTLISPGTERAFFLKLENTSAPYPLYPGYSNISEVIAVGADVEILKVGDRVASTAPHATHALVRADSCLKVPNGLADEEAVFFNLIAIAMQGVRKARIELGESVVVIGLGPIGLFAGRLAQLSGGLPVIGVDVDAKRLQMASQIAVDDTLASDADFLHNIQQITRQDGANVVIEATGAAQVVVLAFQAAATRGRVVLLSSSRGLTQEVNFYRDVHRRGIHVIGGHEITRPRYENSPGYWTQRDEHAIALDLLARGRIQTQPLVTHRYNWQDFTKAYALLAEWRGDALGMVVEWD